VVKIDDENKRNVCWSAVERESGILIEVEVENKDGKIALP
jgi:hypothetical protein